MLRDDRLHTGSDALKVVSGLQVLAASMLNLLRCGSCVVDC